MPTGLEIVGSHGIVQVDENYKVPALRHKLTGLTGNFSFAAVRPIVCLAGANPVLLRAVHPDNANPGNFVAVVVASGAFTAYIFDDPIAPGTGNEGFQVWRADGSLVFDSRLLYLRVATQSNLDKVQLGQGGSVVLPGLVGTKTYAMLVTRPGLRIISGGSPSGFGQYHAAAYSFGAMAGAGYAYAVDMQSFTLSVGSAYYDSYNDGTARDGQAIAVDVTGF